MDLFVIFHAYFQLYISYRANWVRVLGTKYQPPFAIVIGKDDDDLQFESVERILDDKGIIWFEFTFLLTHEYLHHYHAYSVKVPPVSLGSVYLIRQTDILDFHPYGLYCSPKFVVIQHCNMLC